MRIGKGTLVGSQTGLALHFLLFWVWEFRIVLDTYKSLQARFRVFFVVVVVLAKQFPKNLMSFWSVFFNYYLKELQRSFLHIVFNKEPQLYLLACVFSLSPGVLNEWYLLELILNYRLRWDGNSLYLIFFLRMVPITWQKILKGRFFKKAKEALAASSELCSCFSVEYCGSRLFQFFRAPDLGLGQFTP